MIREIRLALRQRGDAAAMIGFGFLMVTLFPFALSPVPDVLTRFSPGLMHLVMFLALMLGLDRFFQHDLESGTLDVLVHKRINMPLYVSIRSLGLWLCAALPLILVSPFYMLFLQVSFSAMVPLMSSLLMGGALIVLLGTAGAALGLGARRAPMLLSLLLVPLYIPVMIFAVQMAGNALGSPEYTQALFLLLAMLAFYIVLVPFVSAAALRAAVEASSC